MRRWLSFLVALLLLGVGACAAQDSVVGSYHPIDAVRVGNLAKGKKRWVEMDYGDAEKTYFQVLPGYEFVTQVHDAHGRSGWLQRVGFRFQVPRACRKADRRVLVRVYRYDAQGDRPGEALLLDTLIIDSPKGRHTVDLSRYNIPFPREGVCVGIKWLSQQGCSSDKGWNTRNIQPLIGITYSADAPGHTWKRYDNRPDLGWVKDVAKYPSRMAFNLRVRAEVLFEE